VHTGLSLEEQLHCELPNHDSMIFVRWALLQGNGPWLIYQMHRVFESFY
jgi:hypothetical protein